MMRSLVGMATADGHVKDCARYLRHVRTTWILRNISKWKEEHGVSDLIYDFPSSAEAVLRSMQPSRCWIRGRGFCDRSLIGC
jgi:hypothetical protein